MMENSNRGYRFLVMQSNPNTNTGFLTANLGGSHRSCSHDENITGFCKHDFGGGHQNDTYWNSAESLMIGFINWYLREPEKISYNMGNRFYHAMNTYRFFRVDKDLDDIRSRGTQYDLANKNLAAFEITEEEFIKNMFESWEYQQISKLFNPVKLSPFRTEPSPVQVDVVINSKTDTWSWISDYLSFSPEEHLSVQSLTVPVGYYYQDAIKHLSELLKCNYKFGGNDG